MDFNRSISYQKWLEQALLEFDAQSEADIDMKDKMKQLDEAMRVEQGDNHIITITDWDKKTILSNLSVLEQKIHQLRELVHMISNKENQFSIGTNKTVARNQLRTSDLSSIIIELITTASNLLPFVRNPLLGGNTFATPLDNAVDFVPIIATNDGMHQNRIDFMEESKVEFYNHGKTMNSIDSEFDYHNQVNVTVPDQVVVEENDTKGCEDEREEENSPPNSYEVLQLEKEEILAPHTHFCSICGKGFKRDANLRMHMRGHGDEYKTPAALAKPSKGSSLEPAQIKRYSCPYVGCKRNKDHEKFQPLKTILCVKNHYKRSHCDKSYTCSRCNNKKFSVLADLKTHEKHCGRDRWLCSCGTTFSRKDKLFGHVALFHGHTPVLPMETNKGTESSDKHTTNSTVAIEAAKIRSYNGVVKNGIQHNMKEDNEKSFFSSVDCYSFTGIHEFSGSQLELSEDSLSFLPSCSYKN